MLEGRRESISWIIGGSAVVVLLGMFPVMKPPVYFISFLFTVFMSVNFGHLVELYRRLRWIPLFRPCGFFWYWGIRDSHNG